MLTNAPALTQMSGDDLVSAATRLAAEGREATADLVALLVVLDERKQVYADEGYSSLFRFCVGRLRLSEEEAYYRIAAARVAARFPEVLDRVRAGVLTLSAVAVLRKHLTDENHGRLLREAEGRSKHEVQQLVAALAPRPDVPPSIRRLPAPRASVLLVPSADDQATAPSEGVWTVPAAPAQCAASPTPDAATPANADATLLLAPERQERKSVASAGVARHVHNATDSPPQLPAPPARRPEIRPLAPARYSLHVTISEETYGKLQQAKDLLRHTLPGGDPAAVIDLALTLLVTHLQRGKFGAKPSKSPAPKRPAPSARPALEPRRQALEEAPAPLATRPPLTQPAPSPGAPSSESMMPSAPRTHSRYIPAAVRREVWQRDGGTCAFVGKAGRCGETGGLEFHHRLPFAEGGQATEGNTTLRCRTHNLREASRWFGDEATTYRGRQGEEPRVAQLGPDQETSCRNAVRPA